MIGGAHLGEDRLCQRYQHGHAWLYNAIVCSTNCNPMHVMVQLVRQEEQGKWADDLRGLPPGDGEQHLSKRWHRRRLERWMNPMFISEDMTRGKIFTGCACVDYHIGGTSIRLPCPELGVFLAQNLPGGTGSKLTSSTRVAWRRIGVGGSARHR